METRRKEESKRASAEAQEVLRYQKRRYALDIHNSVPRKKAKLKKGLDIPTLIPQEPPPSHAAGSSISFFVSSRVINNELNGCNYDNAVDQHIRGRNFPALAGAPCNINSTSGQPLAYPAAMEDTTHNASTFTGDLDFTNPIIDKPMHFTESQYSTIQDTAAIAEAPSARAELMDGSAVYTNNEVSMAPHIATTRRPLGFGSHTMDGSSIYLDDSFSTAQNPITPMNASTIYYPDKQHSTTRDAATAIRLSVFESHTMDGSSIVQATQFWQPT